MGVCRFEGILVDVTATGRDSADSNMSRKTEEEAPELTMG